MKIAKIRRIRKIVYFMPLLGLLLYIHAHTVNTPREGVMEFLDKKEEILLLLQVLYFIVSGTFLVEVIREYM